MIFKQHKDGSCDIEFSYKERWIILKKGKIHFSAEALRHFGNNLVWMVSDWNLRFNDEIKNKNTYNDTKIEGK